MVEEGSVRDPPSVVDEPLIVKWRRVVSEIRPGVVVKPVIVWWRRAVLEICPGS